MPETRPRRQARSSGQLLKRSARSMPNPEDENSCRVRSIENDIRIWPHHCPADIALIGETPGIRVICKQINNDLKASLYVVSALRRARINVPEDFG
jgi:hypothetical protein